MVSKVAPVHDMKEYGRVENIASLLLNLSTRGVNGKLHTLLA
jgi:hypothetical protein